MYLWLLRPNCHANCPGFRCSGLKSPRANPTRPWRQARNSEAGMLLRHRGPSVWAVTHYRVKCNPALWITRELPRAVTQLRCDERRAEYQTLRRCLRALRSTRRTLGTGDHARAEPSALGLRIASIPPVVWAPLLLVTIVVSVGVYAEQQHRKTRILQYKRARAELDQALRAAKGENQKQG